MDGANLQVVAVLMPPEINCHKVPHLKALTRSIDHRGGHGRGSTFKQRYTGMKCTILLHKWPKLRFHVTVAVCRKVNITLLNLTLRFGFVVSYSCRYASTCLLLFPRSAE